MSPTGFEPVKGKHFTFQTTPAGAWDGVIHCQVLEAIPNERLAYCLERRTRGQCRLRRAAGHCRHLDPFKVGERHAPSPRPFRLRPAEERTGVQEHGRGLEEGRAEASASSPRTGPPEKAALGSDSRKTTAAADFSHIVPGGEQMSEAYTGGCACGAVRYEISGEPMFMNDCQCRDCQRKSGTGHGSYLTFPGKQRREARRRGDALGHRRRQRQCEDARLLPDLRVAGLYDVCGDARSVHRARREPRRSQPIQAAGW